MSLAGEKRSFFSGDTRKKSFLSPCQKREREREGKGRRGPPRAKMTRKGERGGGKGGTNQPTHERTDGFQEIRGLNWPRGIGRRCTVAGPTPPQKSAQRRSEIWSHWRRERGRKELACLLGMGPKLDGLFRDYPTKWEPGARVRFPKKSIKMPNVQQRRLNNTRFCLIRKFFRLTQYERLIFRFFLEPDWGLLNWIPFWTTRGREA